jgi:hypothetical protein
MINTAILQDDSVLAEMVRRLIDTFNPERIYLFGSKARAMQALKVITI